MSPRLRATFCVQQRVVIARSPTATMRDSVRSPRPTVIQIERVALDLFAGSTGHPETESGPSYADFRTHVSDVQRLAVSQPR